GATTAARAAARAPAILTLVGDVAKGFLAVTAAAAVAPGQPWPVAAAGVAAIAGNCWSVFLGFRGGKGVATGLGAFLYLAPWAVAPAAFVWLAITLSFRYVSLGSVLAALCVPLGTLMLWYPAPRIAACAAAAPLVILR